METACYITLCGNIKEIQFLHRPIKKKNDCIYLRSPIYRSIVAISFLELQPHLRYHQV